MTSDHRLIFYSILVAHKALIYDQKRKIYDFKRANFDGLRKSIIDADFCSILQGNSDVTDINLDWLTWKNLLLNLSSKFVPSRYVNRRRARTSMDNIRYSSFNSKKIYCTGNYLKNRTECSKIKFGKLRSEVKKAIPQLTKILISTSLDKIPS
jgi:hypothetical protein